MAKYPYRSRKLFSAQLGSQTIAFFHVVLPQQRGLGMITATLPSQERVLICRTPDRQSKGIDNQGLKRLQIVGQELGLKKLKPELSGQLGKLFTETMSHARQAAQQKETPGRRNIVRSVCLPAEYLPSGLAEAVLV